MTNGLGTRGVHRASISPVASMADSVLPSGTRLIRSESGRSTLAFSMRPADSCPPVT